MGNITKPEVWEQLVTWIGNDPELRGEFVIRGTAALRLAYGLSREPKDIDVLSRRVGPAAGDGQGTTAAIQRMARSFEVWIKSHRGGEGASSIAELREFPIEVRLCYVEFRPRALHLPAGGSVFVPDLEYLMAEKLIAVSRAVTWKLDRAKDVFDIAELLRRYGASLEVHTCAGYVRKALLAEMDRSFEPRRFDDSLRDAVRSGSKNVDPGKADLFNAAWGDLVYWVGRMSPAFPPTAPSQMIGGGNRVPAPNRLASRDRRSTLGTWGRATAGTK